MNVSRGIRQLDVGTWRNSGRCGNDLKWIHDCRKTLAGFGKSCFGWLSARLRWGCWILRTNNP